jgi:hypothetical protein
MRVSGSTPGEWTKRPLKGIRRESSMSMAPVGEGAST